MDQVFKPGIKHFEAVAKFVNVLTHSSDYLGGSLNIIRYVDRGNKKRLVSLVVFRRQIFYG
jgi:glutaredoxin 2